MSLLGLLVVASAAYHLRATPLYGPALITAAVHVAAWAARAGFVARRRAVPRMATAIGHVTAALGGFFLLVSFSLH